MSATSELNTQILNIHYLILDQDKLISSVILNSLDSFGVPAENIIFSSSQEESIKYIRENKPAYLACYFNPENNDIFEVIDEHKKSIPDNFERYFLAFSKNKSLFTFAQALEEEIDGYIVEPYTQLKVLQKIQNTIKSKQSPSKYKLLLNEIKNKIETGDYKSAQLACNIAMTLHPRPASVFYYLALIKIAEKDDDAAITATINGLKFNKEHFRCLLLLHDLYFKKSNFDRAYKVLKRVLERFPLSMHRMFDVFRSGISAGHFDEIEGYCKKVLREEDNDKSIIQFCTSGLIICAMNTLSKKSENKGIELLKDILKYSKSDPKILRNIYKCYITFGLFKNAELILKIFKKENKVGLDFNTCIYLKEIYSTMPIDMMIVDARTRLIKVQFDNDCFDGLLKRANKEASKESLETLKKIGLEFGFIDHE